MDGILKFVTHNPQQRHRGSKKCFPQKSSGVSKEAPVEFHLRNSLVDSSGYLWKQPAAYSISNNNYLHVLGKHDILAPTDMKQDHQDKLNRNSFCFNRRKGLLSDFLDKHAFQRGVTKLMGFQRSDQGRSLRNSELKTKRQDATLRRMSLFNVTKEWPLPANKTRSATKHQSHLSQTYTGPLKQLETYISRPPMRSESQDLWGRSPSTLRQQMLAVKNRPKSTMQGQYSDHSVKVQLSNPYHNIRARVNKPKKIYKP